MTVTTTSSFLDTAVARLIALLLAGLIGYVLYAEWGSQIMATVQGEPISLVADKAPANEAAPALDACLAKRVGDVEAMKSDGVITEAQYADFKASAIQLCRAQNPTRP